MVRADCFSGLFGGFEILRRSRSEFAGGSSPPQAAKCVRTNSRILHHFGNSKPEEAASLRSLGGQFVLDFRGKNELAILKEEKKNF
ncbi:MAG: hypothetical protein Athens101410_502 [Parcubacteria group bacterium Athens1014_10]|nr:MAG: hypothetical protein Athens101410_502 [Parcubacteria group bacterium Athens1014_10]